MSDKIIPFAGLREKYQPSSVSSHNDMLLMRMQGVPMQTGGEMTEEDRAQNPNVDPRASELTRLQEENERLRKELSDARDWSPEMKAAAMADAQKVCDLTTTLEELLRVMEPLAVLADTLDHATSMTAPVTVDSLRSLSEAYRKAKGK